ncbi:GSCFA domain-containing protein [Methylobacterium sp. Leaf456]|uniref:GSCFA domain-containing protein n=1 Tax=Methylobacterium sp. Leaf456 TaxID=1736382 RepID=UPI0006FD5D39|nr:GSCFA domain-containing protein [Methylobacterium sp. Leaf456]KQT57199.1 GSCFA domain-containing protein [Methylobacterium sp. Leaf456]
MTDRPSPQKNPYAGLADHAFWDRSVGGVPLFALDPMAGPPVPAGFRLTRQTRIATAGSCFAQHIADRLQASGYLYLVTEDATEGTAPEIARARGFRLFSARYGNVYTARQLRQLIERAYGRFRPQDTAWTRPDGRFADPFRPRIEPDGFASVEAVEAERETHLAQVRRLFGELDVFVFTLGLTEGWQAAADGAAFPLSPGVAAGTFDPQKYFFANQPVEEVIGDLTAFADALKAVNPGARIILTVSPVPLVATYAPRHVLQSTVHSKAVLRVAAQRLADTRDDTLYFPSYEIVTSPEGASRYLESDLRSVSKDGVDHVMRVFFRHLTEGGDADALPASSRSLHEARAEFAEQAAVICDEELLAGGARPWLDASSSSAPTARSRSWAGAFSSLRRMLRSPR